MIVGPTPLAPGRTETSGTELLRSSSGTGDDAFGRTLSNALRADRSETDNDRVTRRPGDDDPEATNQSVNDREPAEADTAEDRQAVGDDRPTGTDRRGDPGLDAEAPHGRRADEPEAPAVGVVASATPAPEDLGIDTAGEDGMAEQTLAAEATVTNGSAESGRTVATQAADPASTSADGTVEGLPARPVDNAESTPVTVSTDTQTDDGEATGIGPAVVLGDEADTTQRTGRPTPSVEPDIEPVESNDKVADTGGPATAVAAETDMTTASTAPESLPTEPTMLAATAAMADRRPPSAPDGESADTVANPTSPIPVSDDAGVAPLELDQRATAREPEAGADSPTGEPAPSPAAGDLVDGTEAQPVTGGDETVDQSTGLRNDRPALGLSPVASYRAPLSTPSQPPAAAVGDSSTTPNLVELQTAGLAERLRPAFAAVRRGVNGLDELRLRIQDDSAGPIKVDIATIDNRVRVLLSAGSDDLMRQLGQDRDRLADELRRAGFDQASIDIESDSRDEPNNRPDRGDSSRPGSGNLGTGTPGTAAPGSTEHASSRRHRGLTGLDLDL